MRARNQLLVEGKDDLHMFLNLCERHGVPHTFTPKEMEGIDNVFERVAETFEVSILGSDIQRLGIVVDADLDIAARWKRLRSILRSSGYKNVPQKPVPEGLVISQTDLPRVGIWVM